MLDALFFHFSFFGFLDWKEGSSSVYLGFLAFSIIPPGADGICASTPDTHELSAVLLRETCHVLG